MTATTDKRAARAAHGGMVRAQRCAAGLESSEPGSRAPPFPADFFGSIVAGSTAPPRLCLPPFTTSNNLKRKEKGRLVQSSVPAATQLLGGVGAGARRRTPALSPVRRPAVADRPPPSSPFPAEGEEHSASLGTGGNKPGMKPTRMAPLVPQGTDTSSEIPARGHAGSRGSASGSADLLRL